VHSQFLSIARDPQIIPGVHHYCDEWCTYCPVTNRCLGFRCTQAFRKRHRRTETEPTFTSVDEAADFTRQLSAVEGLRTDELDALMANPPGQSGVQTSDPLVDLAWEYAERITILMWPQALRFATVPAEATPGGPTPEEIVIWYHLRIYMKVFRALVALESHSEGARGDEARGCAKLALVSIERSHTALASLRATLGEGEVDALLDVLRQLREGTEERFPDARSFVRLGLDYPVA
jgi:hypothetical protein